MENRSYSDHNIWYIVFLFAAHVGFYLQIWARQQAKTLEGMEEIGIDRFFDIPVGVGLYFYPSIYIDEERNWQSWASKAGIREWPLD